MKESDTVSAGSTRVQLSKQVLSNVREIARWLNSHYEQDIGRDATLDILTRSVIQDHPDAFQDKGNGLFVYNGDSEGIDGGIQTMIESSDVGIVELDCGDTVATVGEPSEDSDRDSDDKITFSLNDGPGE